MAKNSHHTQTSKLSVDREYGQTISILCKLKRSCLTSLHKMMQCLTFTSLILSHLIFVRRQDKYLMLARSHSLSSMNYSGLDLRWVRTWSAVALKQSHAAGLYFMTLQALLNHNFLKWFL